MRSLVEPHPVVPGPGWRERWLAFRNGLISRPGFQRWAAGFPLTRGIARRNTRALFDLCAGFVYAQTLYACVKLDLFRLLRDGPLPVAELARRFDMTEERAWRLLKAAASLGLLRHLRDGRFALADLGAAVNGNPAITAMVEHHAMLYADLADPVALLRGRSSPTQLSAYWLYADHDRLPEASAGSVAAYSGLMAASQAMIAEDILDACPIDGNAPVMDVGGGEGAFLAAVGARYPDRPLMLFDLPPVALRAQAKLDAIGLGPRSTCIGGSFHDSVLPRGAGTITLVRIVHDHDDAAVRGLLRVAFAALPPGGRLILAEPMAGTDGAEPIGDAYFGFYLLAMGSGRARTAEELRGLLQEAGFAGIREYRTRRPLLVRVLSASRTERL